MFDVMQLLEQIFQARETAMGGQDSHPTVNSLIAAFSDSKIDYSQFEELVDELQHEDSKLRQLLKKKPFYEEGRPEGFVHYQYFALWCMLLSTGDDKKKAKIFYHILQDGSGGQDWIAYDDKDFKPGFHLLLDIAVKFPLQATDDHRQDDDFEEQYENVTEEFLDEVFDVDAKLERVEWEQRVVDKANYVFNPSALRRKILAAQ